MHSAEETPPSEGDGQIGAGGVAETGTSPATPPAAAPGTSAGTSHGGERRGPGDRRRRHGPRGGRGPHVVRPHEEHATLHRARVATGAAVGAAGRRVRRLPWRSVARVTGAVLLVVVAVLATQGLLLAGLLIGVVALLDRPRRESPRHHQRAVLRALGLGMGLALVFLLLGFPALTNEEGELPVIYDFHTGQVITPPPSIRKFEEESHWWFVRTSAQVAVATGAITLLLYGASRPHDRRRSRRRSAAPSTGVGSGPTGAPA